MKLLLKIFIVKTICFFAIINFAFANDQMLMITDKNCIFCIVWEKEIGKIYPKTDIAKKFPLNRIEIKDFNKNILNGLEKVNVTPTFIFLKNEKEKGRIYGYTNPEMFWWRIDEILELN